MAKIPLGCLIRIKQAFLCLELHAPPSVIEQEDQGGLDDIWQLLRARADARARPEGLGIVRGGYQLHDL